ncbi:MAG TPA: FlgD immunoglobulin-like domain containing protein [Candidatus Eisenbacteria bacterium]
MAFSPRLERCLLSVALFAACLLGPSAVKATPFWSPDYDISEGDVSDTYTSLNNQRFAAVDDSNNLYITFFDDRNKAGLDDNFEIYIRRFTYNFGSPYITRVTNASNPSRYPSIAILNWGQNDIPTQQDSARVYIAWQDARLFSVPTVGAPASYTIFFRTFQSKGGVGFGPEIQVSPYDSLNAATAPVLTVGDSSRVWIVYTKQNGGLGDLYTAVYHSNTRVMDPPQPLETDPGTGASLPTVAATRDGVVNVVWADTRNGSRPQLFWRKFVPGSGWTAAQQIVSTPGTSTATAPSLIATYNGHLHLTWRDNRDGNSEIYYKEYVPGVGWDAVDTRVTVNSFTQIEPQVDADPANNVYLVWTDLRNGSSNPDIYYTTREAGVWQPEISLVGAGTDTTNQVQHFPGITHDVVGATYVTWSDDRLPATFGRNHDVFYKVGYGFTTAVPTSEKPSLARLLRNYPNPFNPATTVEFTLDRDAMASLRVYDVSGRLVRTLLDSYLAAGRRSLTWDGRDDAGHGVASGAYFLRLEAGGRYLSRTVNLLK